MRNSREINTEEKKINLKNSQDRQYRATFCPAQSRDVRRGVDIKQSFLWPSHCRRRHGGRFLLNIAAGCCRCFASTVVSFSPLLQSSIHFCVQENTHFACPLPVLVSAVHYMSAEPKSSQQCTSVLNWPLMQCKANVFEVLLICFFVCFKNQKVLQLQVLCLT